MILKASATAGAFFRAADAVWMGSADPGQDFARLVVQTT
jgi:hypothetical protein